MTKIIETSLMIRKEPLKSSFSTALRTINELEVVEFYIKTDDGYSVFGETVATPAITGDTLTLIQSDLKGLLANVMLNKTFEDPASFYRNHIQGQAATRSAKAAVDIALHELGAALQEQSLKVFLGCSLSEIESDVTVPLSVIEEIPQLLAARSEFTSFKVKLGNEDMNSCVKKIQLIREITGDDAKIRVDPNQAWTVEESIAFLSNIEKRELKIEYLEQPISAKNKRGLAQIREFCHTKIMADEALFTIEDLEELVQLSAVDLINIKILKSGGITPALEIITLARELGIEFSIGSMMEGDKGILAAILLAGSSRPNYCHDLDAAWWLVNSNHNYSKGKVSL